VAGPALAADWPQFRRPDTSVTARYESLHGPVGSAWTMKDGRFELVATVPPNTRATIRLPGALASVTEGGRGSAAG
jgi:alpha-L-rhamnosidase